MNCIYRSIWNNKTGTFAAVSENAQSAGKKISACTGVLSAVSHFPLKVLATSLMMACGATIYALPAGGIVTTGSASINNGAGSTTITQTTQNAAINWQSFNIGQTEAVRFVQPNSNSVALNRVLGSDPSSILGSLTANGKVFLVNPNGILFGKGAQVNVGGLVASTLNIADSDFMAGNYKFSGAGGGSILNQGYINADGGYVALLGASVSNEGVISAKLGTVALAAGNAITLDLAGDGLLNLTMNEGAVNALVQNGGLIQADGGQVLLTAQAAGSLLQSVVNNTGVIRAQTIENHNGTIRLLADMQSGTVNISGTLDASGTGAGQTGGNVTATGQHVGLFGGHINASGDDGGGTVFVGGGFQGNNPNVQNASATYMSTDSTITADAITHGGGGTVVLWSNDSTRAYGNITARGGAQAGDGGMIETSAHWLDVAGIKVNAGASNGKRGMWLLDPADVTIDLLGDSGSTNTGGVFSPNPGANSSNISVSELVTALTATDVTITTANTGTSGSGLGDINVNTPITWNGVTGTNAATTLTLVASRNVNINQTITANHGNLVVCCGQDVNVNAAISTTDGSVLLAAGRDINMSGAMTTVRGNIAMCAGNDVNVNAAISLTNGSSIPAESLASLGVQRGLTLMAGTAGTGPGVAGGTVVINSAPGAIAVTGADATDAPVNIFYNPTSYATPTDYLASGKFTLVASPLLQHMLVYPEVQNQIQGGSTTVTFTGLLKADTSGVTPTGVTLVGVGTGNFDSTASLGTTPVTFTGFTLAGANVDNFALPNSCCAPRVSKTTGNIIAATTPTPTPTPTPAPTPTPTPIAVITPSTTTPTSETLVIVPVWIPEVIPPKTPLELTIVPSRTPPELLALVPILPPCASANTH